MDQDKRRLETLHLDVLVVMLVNHRLHRATARQLVQRLGHHEDTGHVVRALKQPKDILGLEHRLGVDAHVGVKIVRQCLETIGPGLLLAHHNLVAALSTLHHEVGPRHQKVRRVLGTR